MSLASRKLIQATAGAAGVVDTGDDDFANVVLLLDGDGTSGDNNETFTDSSTNGFTVTENGSVVQGSFSPYGDNWSNYFDGSDRLNLSSVTAVGTSDATIEFWFWASNETVAYRSIYDSRSTTGTDTGFGIFQYGKTIEVYGNGLKVSTAANAFNGNEWVHFALVRSSGSCQIYINGTASGSSGAYSSNLTSTARAIGDSVNSSFAYYGYISNLREDHSAVYTSGFTPSTTPLATLTNTKVLTCSANRFLDESTNAYSITVTGTPKVTPFSPFKDDDARDITTDGGSGYFEDANNEHLSINHQSEFLISGQQFTIEFWFYPVRSGVDDHIASYNNGNTDGNLNWLFRQINNDSLRFVVIQSNSVVCFIDSTSKIIVNGWNHVVATGDGSSFIKMWLNGNYEGSTSTNGTNQNNTSNAKIEIAKWLNYYAGYISDFRYVVGSQVYTGTSDITLPTSPLTAVTNTELLLNFQDAGIYDRSGINNLDTVGDAQIDTAVTKYGTGSMEFDGTGDYLLLPASEELAMGTGDFTIEMWVNLNSATDSVGSQDGVFVEMRSSGATANGFVFNCRPSPTSFVLNFYTNGGANLATTGMAYSTWHHIAVTRESGTVRLFVNGTVDKTFTKTNDFSDTPNVTIGQSTLYSSSNISGYIDDLRITKGVARYTANFTPPTAELPKF